MIHNKILCNLNNSTKKKKEEKVLNIVKIIVCLDLKWCNKSEKSIINMILFNNLKKKKDRENFKNKNKKK